MKNSIFRKSSYRKKRKKRKKKTTWNSLGKCFCFKLNFLKIEFQWKTQFLENQVIEKKKRKKKRKKKLHGTQVPCSFFKVTRFLPNWDFIETRFSNNQVLKCDIFLNSFRIETFCWNFWVKGVFCYFYQPKCFRFWIDVHFSICSM